MPVNKGAFTNHSIELTHGTNRGLEFNQSRNQGICNQSMNQSRYQENLELYGIAIDKSTQGTGGGGGGY